MSGALTLTGAMRAANLLLLMISTQGNGLLLKSSNNCYGLLSWSPLGLIQQFSLSLTPYESFIRR